MPQMRNSPRIAEWFGGLPHFLAVSLFFLSTSIVIGAAFMPLALLHLTLSAIIRKRIPITWLGRGSPPFVGAAVYLAAVVLLNAVILYLASLED